MLRSILIATFLTLPSLAIGGSVNDARAASNRGDYGAAYALARPLADQDSADAQYFLGQLCGLHPEVPCDRVDSINWYRRAARQDAVAKDDAIASSLAALALCTSYFNGLGAEQNYSEAAPWCRAAAEKRIPAGMELLGRMYAKGEGVLQNYILAHMWLNLAGSQYARDERDALAAKMTTAQVAEAQRLAAEWLNAREKEKNATAAAAKED